MGFGGLGKGRREEGRTGCGDEAQVVRYRRVVDDGVCDHDDVGSDGLLGGIVRGWGSVSGERVFDRSGAGG